LTNKETKREDTEMEKEDLLEMVSEEEEEVAAVAEEEEAEVDPEMVPPEMALPPSKLLEPNECFHHKLVSNFVADSH
jgi:hypothetical protein